jgi:hypothetical protein
MSRQRTSLHQFCVCQLYSHFVFVDVYVNIISLLFKYQLFRLCRLGDHNRVTVFLFSFGTVNMIKYVRPNSSTLKESCRTLEISRNTNPGTMCHVSEDLNFAGILRTVNLKVKFTSEHSTKAQRGSIALLLL